MRHPPWPARREFGADGISNELGALGRSFRGLRAGMATEADGDDNSGGSID